MEISSKYFQNCKFINISFNLTIIDKKNKFPKSLLKKNKNLDIIFKFKNNLYHNIKNS